MNKYELYIDFDGVILDTLTPIYEKIKSLGDNLTTEEIDNVFLNYPWKDLIKDEIIINDGINCIHKLIKSGKFNISILTHVCSLEEAMVKIKYIRKHFDDITIIPCPKKISKTKMIHTKDSILVDDYSGNLKEWKEAGGIPVKFSNKENKIYPTIDKLDKIIDMFK